MDKEEHNYLTEENRAKILKVTSEMNGSIVSNILTENKKTVWLSEKILPQEIIIDISSLIIKPPTMKAIGIYCWHAYESNPKLIEILTSTNNKIYNSSGNFELDLKVGLQVLDLDSLPLKSINYIKLIIKETYGAPHTYLNKVFMYDDIPHNDLVVSVQGSRERNMPRMTTSSILKKEIMSSEFGDDLLDMKSTDYNPNPNNNNNKNRGSNILLTSDNQMLISDSELSEKMITYIKTQEQLTSRIMEESEDKEKSSVYNTIKKDMKLGSNRFHDASIENDEVELQLRESEFSYQSLNKRLNTNEISNKDYHNIEPEFDRNDNHHIQKELFKSTDDHQIDPMNNPNLLSNYLNTNSVEDLGENIDHDGYQENLRNYQNYQNEKYMDVDMRLSSLEKDVSTIKDQLSRIAQNIEAIVETQNTLNESTYGYILEECRQMIDMRIGNALTNLNLYRSDHSYSQSQRDIPIPPSSYSKARNGYSIHKKNTYDRNRSSNKRSHNNSQIDNSANSFIIEQNNNNNLIEDPLLNHQPFNFEKDLDNKLEEKFINFSNQLGQKITDTLLKPSITQLENFMKGNLNEMKMHLKNAEKKSKNNKHHQQSSKMMRKEEQLIAKLDKLQNHLDVEEKKEYHNLPLKMNNEHYVQYSNSHRSGNDSKSGGSSQRSNNKLKDYLP